MLLKALVQPPDIISNDVELLLNDFSNAILNVNPLNVIWWLSYITIFFITPIMFFGCCLLVCLVYFAEMTFWFLCLFLYVFFLMWSLDCFDDKSVAVFVLMLFFQRCKCNASDDCSIIKGKPIYASLIFFTVGFCIWTWIFKTFDSVWGQYFLLKCFHDSMFIILCGVIWIGWKSIGRRERKWWRLK